MKLLVIEDENELLTEIVTSVRSEGYVCESARNFNDALEKINLYAYDCLIVDITLPGGNGLQLIDAARKVSKQTGFIIISARDSLQDKITGLEIGADDYLTKPFHLAELNARISAVLRRKQFGGEDILSFNELTLCVEKHEVSVNGIQVQLTRKEFDLLLYFFINKNRVLTRESIAEHIWGDHADSFDSLDFVYSQIKNTRKKLLKAGCADYIKSIYGVGYKFSES